MAISLTRDDRRRWLLARASGTLSADEVAGFLQSARGDVDLRIWPLLFDACGCQTSITADDITALVEIVSRIASRERRAHAAVVADDDVTYRMLLLYETRCAEAGVRVIRVFRQRADAERWLEIVSAAREYA